MRIKQSGILVEDQGAALRFYTEVLGFRKKQDIPMGAARWLTVVSPEAPDEVELLLEPTDNIAARDFQRALYAQGVPLTAFAVRDIRRECDRLKGLGVVFRSEPQESGSSRAAVFDDTCGNWIQLYEG